MYEIDCRRKSLRSRSGSENVMSREEQLPDWGDGVRSTRHMSTYVTNSELRSASSVESQYVNKLQARTLESVSVMEQAIGCQGT